MEDELRSNYAAQISQQLHPIFAATTAFSGAAYFEIQLGQVLLPRVHGDNRKFYKPDAWREKFCPPNFTAHTSFTNLLTANGKDLDDMLEMKGLRGGVKLWNKLGPGISEVTYEFHCQAKDSQSFLLVVESTGAYRVRSLARAVGSINIQVPEQIWDACAMIGGIEDFEITQHDVVNAVEELYRSIFIAPGSKNMIMTYQLPVSTEITVTDVVLRRKSLHDCNSNDRIQLQITEVQHLFHRFKKSDRKLVQAFAKDFADMSGQGRAHYEVAVVDKDINASLRKNEDLSLGTIIEAWKPADLLSSSRIRPLLEMTLHILKKIDNVGLDNIGTLFRMADEEARRNESRGLPSTRAPRSIAPSAIHRGNAPMGVRGGPAEITADGRYFHRSWRSHGTKTCHDTGRSRTCAR